MHYIFAISVYFFEFSDYLNFASIEYVGVYVYLNGQVVPVNITRLALGSNTVRRH